MPPNKNNRSRLSPRRTVVVWLAGAVIAWVVAILGIYALMRTGDTLIAEFFNGGAGQDSVITQEEADALSRIAPAAGGNGNGSGTLPNGE